MGGVDRGLSGPRLSTIRLLEGDIVAAEFVKKSLRLTENNRPKKYWLSPMDLSRPEWLLSDVRFQHSHRIAPSQITTGDSVSQWLCGPLEHVTSLALRRSYVSSMFKGADTAMMTMSAHHIQFHVIQALLKWD